MNSPPLFQIERLQVADANCPALSLQPTDIMMISGPSGCGKSRLLRAMADLDPNDGELKLLGRDRQHMTAPEWRRQVMLIPADAVWWEDTVGEHFVTTPAAEWWSALGLKPEVWSWEVSRLSSGERQRLGLLRALVNHPSVLLLDEPTSNLDETNASRVETFLLAYLKQHQAAAFWISHDPAQVKRLNGRVLRFEDSGWKLI